MFSCACVQALCVTREWAELTFYGLFTAIGPKDTIGGLNRKRVGFLRRKKSK
jgi:hypothetical protein